MSRRKETEPIREARLYIRTYVYDTDDTFDATSIHWHELRLERVRADCIRAVNYGNGKISALRTGPTGRYERFDAADARLVLKFLRQRLTNVKRIIAETPTQPLRPLHDEDTDYSWSEKYARHHCREGLCKQREVKRQQRIKAQNSPQSKRRAPTIPEYDELLELELLFKDRVPHRNGWGREYRPTRATWHRHDDNRSWKNHKCRKQYLVHLD